MSTDSWDEYRSLDECYAQYLYSKAFLPTLYKSKKHNMSIQMNPIGVIHSPFKTREETPRQARYGTDYKASVEVFKEFQEGLDDLDGFSHIILLFYLDRTEFKDLKVHPRRDHSSRGLFATRAPSRPNKIGLSVVRLINIENNILEIEGVDMLDKSPLLDIKPYIPALDEKEEYKLGWLEGKF
jgi:tRNA-Thr(GGU) m(6)t(6)A37 methyltransferase TsaA